MTTLHIVAIGTGEAHALRAAAEYWGAFVTVTWVGNSGQIVEYFSKCPVHDLIIIAGHGDERGLLLPELAEEIQGSASLMYSLDFLYNYLHYGQHVEAAHLKASNYADDRKQFQLYQGAS